MFKLKKIMKKIITSIFIVCSLSLFAQNVNIPDANFKEALTTSGSLPGNKTVDINGDGEIQKSEAEAVIEILYLSDVAKGKIQDLTGIEAFVNMKLLVCASNELTSLDVSMLSKLEEIVVMNNKITSLKTHPNLLKITCNNNLFTGILDLSKNVNLIYCNVNNNPNLETVCVPSLKQVTENDFYKTGITQWSEDCSDIITICDENFLKALIKQGVDENNDGKIQIIEAEKITTLDVSKSNISDLCGIEAFVNLVNLNCSNNLLVDIDLTKNVLLQKLNCYTNQLSSLDVTKNINLISVSCAENQLSNLDITKNINLKALSFYSNNLINIDVSNNINLTHLYCDHNKLTSLNLNTNKNLILLNCHFNQLTSLDVSQNTKLKILYVRNNPLNPNDIVKRLGRVTQNEVTIDLSQNPALTFLNCANTGITSLDLSNNLLLDSLDCSENKLTSLDVSKQTELIYLHCDKNPNLPVVYVYSLAQATTNTDFVKDETTNWIEPTITSTNEFVSEKSKILKAYNTQGREVSIDTKGELIILLYSDGTTEKVFQD